MKKLWVEQGEALPAVVFQEDAPNENFDDKSSDIVSWDVYGLNALQFIQVRGYIFDLVIGIVTPNFSSWGNLTSDEKKIACKWWCAPYALRITQYSDADDFYNCRLVIEQTAGKAKDKMFGRDRVVEEMRQHIALNYYRKEQLSKVNADDFYSATRPLLLDYIASNSTHFYDWLNNSTGTDYENDGFAQKSYYSVNIKNELNDIQNYNY